MAYFPLLKTKELRETVRCRVPQVLILRPGKPHSQLNTGPGRQQRPERNAQAAAGELLGLDWRPSRSRECQSHWRTFLHRVLSGAGAWRASGLSHLTYQTTGTVTLHRLDQPPFPCKSKLRRIPPPRQAPRL